MARSRATATRPDGPIVLDRDSAAAQGLSLWIPLNGDFVLRGVGNGGIDAAPTVTSVTRDGHPAGGSVAVFDSGTDKLDYGSAVPDGADNTGQFTLSAWVNVRTLDSPTTGRQWVSRWGTTVSTRRWLLSQKDSDGANLRFATGNGTSIVVFDSTGSPLAANSRNLVTVVWNGSASPKMRFYVNGVEVGRTSLVDQGITTLGTATTNLTIGANANAGTSSLLADVSDVMFWGRRVLSDREIWRLYDPATRYEHYWKKATRVVVPAIGGGDVTVGLTGVAASAAIGAIGVALAVGLSGAGATGSTGGLSPNTTVGIIGSAATGAVGTVSAGSNVTVALTGVSSATAVGSVGSARSVAVAGVASATAVGTPAPGTARGITGNAATSGAGSVGVATSVALAGAQAAGGVGTVTTGSDVTAALTGVSASASVGTVGPNTARALTGAASSTAVGSVGRGTAVGLAGNQAAGAVGSVGTSGGIQNLHRADVIERTIASESPDRSVAGASPARTVVSESPDRTVRFETGG